MAGVGGTLSLRSPGTLSTFSPSPIASLPPFTSCYLLQKMRYIYDVSSNKTRSSTGYALNEDVVAFDALQPAMDHGRQVQPQTLEGFMAFEYPELPNNSEVRVPTLQISSD